MKKLTIQEARKFAEEKFKVLSELEYTWNLLHCEYMIQALEKFKLNEEEKAKLGALAWIHDIGKIKSYENHAETSVEIIKENFELDETDIDCILNHGSSTTPKTELGKILRFCDGLSLFYPGIINYRFFAEAKEGFSFEEIKSRIASQYEKYKKVYSDSKEVVSILENLYQKSA